MGVEPPGQRGREEPGCEFQGRRYRDQDVFPSNKTALKLTSDKQCVLCGCFVSLSHICVLQFNYILLTY